MYFPSGCLRFFLFLFFSPFLRLLLVLSFILLAPAGAAYLPMALLCSALRQHFSARCVKAGK